MRSSVRRKTPRQHNTADVRVIYKRPDVSNLKPQHLSQPEPSGIDGREYRAVLEVTDHPKYLPRLIGSKNHRKPCFLFGAGTPQSIPLPAEAHFIEQPQGTVGLVNAGLRYTILHPKGVEMQLSHSTSPFSSRCFSTSFQKGAPMESRSSERHNRIPTSEHYSVVKEHDYQKATAKRFSSTLGITGWEKLHSEAALLFPAGVHAVVGVIGLV